MADYRPLDMDRRTGLETAVQRRLVIKNEQLRHVKKEHMYRTSYSGVQGLGCKLAEMGEK